jgi:hypothetical protein
MRELVLRTVHAFVDEIVDLAASEKGSVATLLRKCLVLADTLRNNQLKAWAENELLGYERNHADLPEYRKVPAIAKGLFIAPRGGAINEQPIPSVMLELRNDLGAVSDDVTRLSMSAIDRNVVVNIFGDSNVIASKDFAQVNRIEIERADWASLAEALRTLGVPSSEISELKSAVDDDAKSAKVAPVSEGRTSKWLKRFATDAGKWELKTGVEVGKKIVTKWLEEYFGIGS